MMDLKTMGIIYAAKYSNDPHKAIRAFMCKYSGSDESVYNLKIINELTTKALCDCLDHVEHPSQVMHDYFMFRSSPWFYSPFDATIAAFQNIQVRRVNYDTDEYVYINGFGELDEKYKVY